MKFDPSYSPNEAAEGASEVPNCSSCADSGVYENFVGERDFCDCASGEIAHNEWCSEQDDMDCEGGLFEDDADALASCGWGTDEDYGAY